MSRPHNVGQELQDDILDTVRGSQDATVDVVRSWAEAVRHLAPPLPEFAARLPQPLDLLSAEVLDSAYGFVEQLLAAHQEFVYRVLDALIPLVEPRRSHI